MPKIALGIPWYTGPDVDTFPDYFVHLNYYGRVKERSLWFEALRQVQVEHPPQIPALFNDPALDAMIAQEVYDFDLVPITRMSLVGMARELIVEGALRQNADWLFMWDWDMMFDWQVLFRLLQHRKPVVNALAFTARDPIQPCVYRINEGVDPVTKMRTFDSQIVYDFPRGTLISNEHVGGSIAFGAGCILINMNVFRELPKPWFQSTGCGEDWYFCVRCHEHGIPRYVDTSVEVLHKFHTPKFVGLTNYDQALQEQAELYDRLRKRQAA